MATQFFHHKNEDDTQGSAASKYVELSYEQLGQVSGGYIIAGPQGELDWLRKQQYQSTHPGSVIPLVTTN